MIKRFLKDETGTTAIEYGLIAMLIAIAVIGGATQVGTQIQAMWGDTEGKVYKALN